MQNVLQNATKTTLRAFENYHWIPKYTSQYLGPF